MLSENTLRTTVYRKPIHTDRLLDQTSYIPTSLKATIVRTLTRRAKIVCDSHDSLTEIRHLNTVFIKNNYSTDFIERNTYVRPNDSSNNSYTTTCTATIPYIRGTSETIALILPPYNVQVAYKPMLTLRGSLTNVKDKDEPENRPEAVYRIKCSDCQVTYIGEIGRNLTTRLNEHKRATKKGDLNNNIAEHHLKTSHTIDWDSATCLTCNTDSCQRNTLESWFTNLEQTALNRYQTLDSEDGLRTGCRNVSHQRQSFSGLQSPRLSFSIKVYLSWVQTIFFKTKEKEKKETTTRKYFNNLD